MKYMFNLILGFFIILVGVGCGEEGSSASSAITPDKMAKDFATNLDEAKIKYGTTKFYLTGKMIKREINRGTDDVRITLIPASLPNNYLTNMEFQLSELFNTITPFPEKCDEDYRLNKNKCLQSFTKKYPTARVGEYERQANHRDYIMVNDDRNDETYKHIYTSIENIIHPYDGQYLTVTYIGDQDYKFYKDLSYAREEYYLPKMRELASKANLAHNEYYNVVNVNVFSMIADKLVKARLDVPSKMPIVTLYCEGGVDIGQYHTHSELQRLGVEYYLFPIFTPADSGILMYENEYNASVLKDVRSTHILQPNLTERVVNSSRMKNLHIDDPLSCEVVSVKQ